MEREQREQMQRMVAARMPDPEIVEDERPKFAGKGRLVKARFPDTPPPNVRWFWLPVGNCELCAKFKAPAIDGPDIGCLDPDITPRQQLHAGGYLETNECLRYEPGLNHGFADGWPRGADVLRALGKLDGAQTQHVEIMQDLPWSPSTTMQAHAQDAMFGGFAAEAISRGGVGPGRGMEEYYRLDDDLGDIVPDDE